jgi:hypothetical protein
VQCRRRRRYAPAAIPVKMPAEATLAKTTDRDLLRPGLRAGPVGLLCALLLGSGAACGGGAGGTSNAGTTGGNAGAAGGAGNGGAGTTGGAGSGGAGGGGAGGGSGGGGSGGPTGGTTGAAGTTPDAAASDGAPSHDAASDLGAGGTTGCPAGALLCDDFERYATPADLAGAWKVTATMATVTVDATKPHAGAKGLHISSPGGTPVGTLIKESAPLFPIAGNVLYGRMMMWLTKAPTGAVHWNNVQSAGFLPGSTQWSKYGWGGMYGVILAGYTIRTNPTDMQAVIDCSKPSKMGLPEKTWTCLEWEFDGVGNQMHLWLDGALLADADIIKTGTQCVTPKPPNDTWQAPTFANLTLGWAQYQQSSTPIEFWMDDLVLAPQRVGCPTP